MSSTSLHEHDVAPRIHRPPSPLVRRPRPASDLLPPVPEPAGVVAGYDFSRVPISLQAKLHVGAPGDAYEQEADRIAEQVTKSPANQVQRACECGGDCSTCNDDHGPDLPVRVQPKATGSGRVEHAAPPIVDRAIAAPGQALDPAARARLEPRFGHDFSGVRVHSGRDAAGAATAIRARAFTVGSHIVFGAGEYSPNSSGGQRLLAHELTHVLQQHGGVRRIQRNGPQTAPPVVDTDAQAAILLETEILADPVYKKLLPDSKRLVRKILAKAKSKPLGTTKGQRNYYLAKLKLALTTPFKGTETGNAEYGCSPEAEKANLAEVDQALAEETKMPTDAAWLNVEEDAVASGKSRTRRRGQDGKIYFVDRTDPRNIRVKMKVKLKGTDDEVGKIKKLEDAIERKSHTSGYYLDIEFVNKSGRDVFEFETKFCLWANSGNWASGPTTLSHEVHHALGLDDRYDYIESHAENDQMNVPMRLVWFHEQMSKTGGPRDPYSKMDDSSNPLLAEDVCAVAFAAGPARQKCIDARKDLDPAGIPPI